MVIFYKILVPILDFNTAAYGPSADGFNKFEGYCIAQFTI